ncbi:MAG: DUF86 domain-containing protein [Xenococcaceae cyanobacterium MO_167.B52]|nr:DUF86 domain-containing protein [Xenococcaceae cyanobacterium MO_167.B52]
MSNPRTLDRLEDMLRYSEEAVEITQGKTRQDLDNERLLNLAVVRLLEIIGEAANKIPREECLKYPEIPWHAIVSMRNRLIHAYGDIDLDIVWQVVKENLPTLIEQLKVIISNLKRS